MGLRGSREMADSYQVEDLRNSRSDLDSLVAQRVMGLVPCAGWEVTNFGSLGGPALLKRCSHPADSCYSTVTTGSIYGTIGGPLPYSTDIRAGWQVVERILAALPRAEFRLEHSEGSGWRVGTRAEPGRWRWISAETAPEAICRAALAIIKLGSNGHAPERSLP